MFDDTDSRKPASYARQDGCHNCGFVFVRYEHDEEEELSCLASAPPRPPCMSVAADECPGGGGGEGSMRWFAQDVWDAWVEGRECHPAGKCSRWFRRKK